MTSAQLKPRRRLPRLFFVFTGCRLPCWGEVLQDGCKVDRRLNKKTRPVADWLLQHHCQWFFSWEERNEPTRKKFCMYNDTEFTNFPNEGMELVCLADNREMNCSYILLKYQNSFYKQGSTNYGILHFRIGKHGKSLENMQNMERMAKLHQMS